MAVFMNNAYCEDSSRYWCTDMASKNPFKYTSTRKTFRRRIYLIFYDYRYNVFHIYLDKLLKIYVQRCTYVSYLYFISL